MFIILRVYHKIYIYCRKNINFIEKLTDLNSLFKAKNLTRLSLLENSVSKLENYREYLIYNLPSLKYLDFKKIKMKDREAATEVMKNFNPHRKENIQPS
ncbi:U2 small nuclear ribonucleoprotein A', putative [Plasmodium malariae]|uniref:U2 small nuclear ribonucleoprotein A', putative n=1 Tax=Plasmodium malariae TaxID=5858 RepID=A0A1C3KZ49_PLAMA|nr:U2 small nuclear ribonucleoprotein A', putative [Plasmodium malariae]